MFTSLSFGDVFTIDDKEYIFLAQSEDITYAARILDQVQSSTLNKMFNKKLAKGRETTNLIYCYVMLKTKEFENRCALVSNSGQDVLGMLKKLDIILDKTDLDQLKDEIFNGKGASGELKELVKQLQ